MWLIDKLKGLRAGAITGLNATENNVKMTGATLAPFLVMWFFVKVFLPDELYDLGITISMMAWIVWIVMLWAWAKSDAGNYIVFPQSKWKFPDGSCRTFDLKIPPDSWEKIVEFPDGSCGYKVYFEGKYLYEDPDLPYPIIFDGAYWLVPKEWDTAFQRRAFGEFFHKGVFVTKPDCEDISLYVMGFEERQGLMFPVCIVNDCAFTYYQTLQDLEVPKLMRASNPWYLLYRAERKRGIKLTQHTVYLEDSLDIASEESAEDFKKSADRRMKGIRSRHGDVMDVKEPLLSRIFNLKTMAIVLLLMAAIFLFGRLIMKWW